MHRARFTCRPMTWRHLAAERSTLANPDDVSGSHEEEPDIAAGTLAASRDG
jgi:hypothetical protein